MIPRSVCLHGPESTGKSTIGPQLAQHFDSPYVAEFGRTYCERFGTELSMADLVAIARGHDAKTQAALAERSYPVILDTDPLMTAVWADMLFGRRDPWFDAWTGTAELYLLFDIDLPWVEDGTRMFGSDADRRRFFELSKAELVRRKLPWVLIGGTGSRRYLNALDAIRSFG
ncbi:NadR type nicotinamide-nucleotide adenylyltransferase [Sphingomonas jinjuensis]|uniref:NadR type nicotinamide-nucleotide adenylyltransferase n=1 Tax=Sphingomonas jinjuensis TaxID=535907 RepID=A0A840F5S9_9SPHN|nr:AAA family ATPase [Sphingomonas jinjuensis]MBB4154633.1 NadR type nicotinamide-nucleotide adenylyltransferase [Sphingomonas jinjuensis]